MNFKGWYISVSGKSLDANFHYTKNTTVAYEKLQEICEKILGTKDGFEVTQIGYDDMTVFFGGSRDQILYSTICEFMQNLYPHVVKNTGCIDAEENGVVSAMFSEDESMLSCDENISLMLGTPELGHWA